MNWIRDPRGSFAIKKISNITGEGRSGCAELPRWDGVIYFTRELHRRPLARTIPHTGRDHENAILIMWPIRGHRGFPEEHGSLPGGDYRVDER